MEELNKKLSELGQIEVLKNDYVFTLLMITPKAPKIILEVLEIILSHVKDKPNTEIIKNENDYILIILKP
nr:hypothetical protein [uncultured Flavobacterium sp.]